MRMLEHWVFQLRWEADININGGGGFDIDPVSNVGFAALKLNTGGYKFFPT